MIAVVTAMSYFGGYASEFLYSCIQQEISPIILKDCPNWGADKTACYARWTNGDTAKLYDHVLFCDGFDVIFQKPVHSILHTYGCLAKSAVFSAQPICNRYPEYTALFSETETGLRYPSGGLWMGSLAFAKSLLNRMMQKRKPGSDETSLLLPSLLETDRTSWMVDSHCELFADVIGKLNPMTFNAERGMCGMGRPMTYPAALHYPGHGPLHIAAEKLGFPARKTMPYESSRN